MYRTVLGLLEHRKYQCILWRFNESDDLHVYQLNTVTYGLRSSPFLATRTLMQIANDSEKYHSLASQVIHDDFYIDGVQSGGRKKFKISMEI
jgi:hypothetical protein